MESIPVTTKAQEHKMAEGTKILILTDNSSHVSYVDFEADAAPPDPANPDEETTSLRLNTGKNVYQVPEGRDSFSIIGDGDYTIGADYLKTRGAGTDPDVSSQLEDHEARITALEAANAPATAGAGMQMAKQKSEPVRDEKVNYAAKKK